ncbi:MAG: hypothetical protein NTZ39_03640 [Methanoregula sp.]|nr:hypothetical protein [Methanoregula sp.]
MKTNEQENKTGESFGIPERRSEGVAGPSREVSKRDASASGVDDAGQENIDEQNVQTVDATPSCHTGKNPTGGSGKYRSGLEQYLRKRATVMREIPLYMLPAALNCCVRARGEKVYRVVIVRTHWHHYTIKVRCNTKKATEHTDQSQHTDLTNTTGSSKRGGGT